MNLKSSTNNVKRSAVSLILMFLSIPAIASRGYLHRLPVLPGPAIVTEGEFELSGGYEQGRRLARFTMSGSGVFAAKTRGGLFLQAAGSVAIAGDYKEFGVSAGFGYEPGSLGLFLFADGLAVREGSLPSEVHWQLRPAIRLKTNLLCGSLFFAKAVSPDRFLFQERLENEVRLGLFREAIDHLGLDLTVRVGRRLALEGRALLSKQLVRLEGAASVKLIDNLYLGAGYTYTYTTGAIRGMGNHSRVFASITLGAGVGYKFKNLEKRIIMRPDYPIVRAIEKEIPEDKAPSLEVSLGADPQSGEAPLEVTFAVTVTGGSAPYKYAWTIDGSGDSSIGGATPQKTFTAPGEYRVAVTVTDELGKSASSNTVTIIVNSPSQRQIHIIAATSGSGGIIDPAGDVPVPEGESRVFFMKPNTGYRVARVLVDGVSVGAPSSYTFKAVSGHHSIHVEYTQTLSRCFQIVASSDTGGSISPEGTVPVTEGGDVSFAITAETGFKVKRVEVDGKNAGTLNDYKFEKIASDHAIHAVFEPVTYTVAATAGSGGSVAPAGDIAVNGGQSLAVAISPEDGFDISSVLVDGKPVGAVSSYTFANIASDHTLHAEFSKIPVPLFTITATSGAGGGISPSGAVEVPRHTDATFVIRPQAGFRVKNVAIDGVSAGAKDEYTFEAVIADHSIHAEFAPITHIVTATAGTGGRTDPSGAVTVNRGDSLTVRITPDPAYTIRDAKVDGASVGAVASYTFANISADHTLDAVFKKKTFPITAFAGPGGGIDPSGTISAVYGDAMTFAVTPDTGFIVEDLIVDGISRGALLSFTLTDIRAPHTIEARFKLKTFTIQALSGPGGAIRPSGVITVSYGDSKAFRMETSDPKVYELDTVIIDGVSQGPVQSHTFSNITANHTIRASWKLRRYKIEASASEGGFIAPAGTTYYAAAATPTYTATPDPGYEIDRVIIDGAFNVGSSSVYTFDPLYTDHTIRVIFKKKTYTVFIQKAFSDGSSGTPPNPVNPIGAVSVTHGSTLDITIDNHYQGSDPSTIYSLDYISDNGFTTTYRGATKSVVTYTTTPVTAPKTITCFFYRRTN